MPDRRSFITRLLNDELQLPVAIAAGIALALGVTLWFWGTREPQTQSMLIASIAGQVLVWTSLALGAIHGVQAAWQSIRSFNPSIDVLMVVGAGLSAAIGHPEEGALLLFLFTLSGALEHRALAKAKDAVTRLHKLMPKNAVLKRGSNWEPVDAELLGADDIVLVRPGETVPADGVVTSGHSSLDQSSLTGESLPRSVDEGEQVFAGTLNKEGALEVRVTRPVAESSIKRILQLVLEAQERRQPIQRVIDKFSTPYTLSVFAVAILALLGFWFWGRLPDDGGPMKFTDALYRAITLLVVCSPCALVISTPTATLCGLSRAARGGVLIKGGDALERLANVRQVALDKTGTLTTGRIEVTKLEPIAAADVDSLLSLAMAAEQRSTHPIASAIVRLAESHSLDPAELASLVNVPGRGIEGRFGGDPVRIGNYAFCEPMIPVCFQKHTREIVDRIKSGGGIPVVIAHGGETLVLALADTPREGADELATQLHNVGVQTVTMLTGDQKVIAERVARELGIDDVHAELMPEDKVEQIRQLKKDNIAGGVAVIGDGVNDAPALAVADVGLAMGGIGADAALETADVVLLHDDLDRIPWAIHLARRVKRIMMANLAFATAVIVVLATVTVILGIPLSLGVLGHEGSTLLVVANSLRLLAHRGP